MFNSKYVVFILALLFILSFSACETENNPTSNEPVKSGISNPGQLAKAKMSVIKKMSSMQNTSTDNACEDVDAYFSLYWFWFEGYEDEQKELFSMASAFGINEEDYSSYDLGDVYLKYGSQQTKLYKFEFEDDFDGDNYKFIYYDLNDEIGMGLDFDSTDVEQEYTYTVIPLVASQIYTFENTGSDQFPAVSVSYTAPSSESVLTFPEHGSTVDLSNGLTIKWSGNLVGEGSFIEIYPEYSDQYWEDLEDSDWMDDDMDMDDDEDMEDDLEEMEEMWGGLYYEIDGSTNELTISAEDLAELANNPDVIGLYINIFSMVETVNEINGKKIALDVSVGDMAKLKIER